MSEGKGTQKAQVLGYNFSSIENLLLDDSYFWEVVIFIPWV